MNYEMKNAFIPRKNMEKLVYLKSSAQLSSLGVVPEYEWVIIVDKDTGNNIEVILNRQFILDLGISRRTQSAISIKELLLLITNICAKRKSNKLLEYMTSIIPLEDEKWTNFLITIGTAVNEDMQIINKKNMTDSPITVEEARDARSEIETNEPSLSFRNLASSGFSWDRPIAEAGTANDSS